MKIISFGNERGRNSLQNDTLPNIVTLSSPRFLKKKGDYVLPFAVRPCVGPSVSQQFTSISSYTIDARITKLICMIPLCIQMVATYLKFFYYFQF